MNTVFLLLATYNRPIVELDDIARDYLGLGSREARLKALHGELPFLAFRYSRSQRAPWLVHIEDLAFWLDTAREEARAD